MCVFHSVMSDSATPWTMACQTPLSTEFSRQGYWNGLPFPSPGDLPNPGIEPRSPTLQADSLPAEPPGGQPQMSPKLVKCPLGAKSAPVEHDEYRSIHILISKRN